MNISMFNNKMPTMFEHVLVKFTEHTETHIKAELVDYKCEGIMLHDDATRKKRIYNWAKTVPLHKQTVARVEEILGNDCVKLSIAYFDNKKDPIELSKELMKPFQENYALVNIIKKLSNMCSIDFNNFWLNIIYKVDKLRHEEDINMSLLEILKNNLTTINELIIEKYPDNFSDLIVTLNKLINHKNYKIQTKFSIISNSGIDNTKQLLKDVVEKNNWNYTLKYLNAPFYILESSSENTSDNDHNEFVNLLNRNNELIIKIEYVAQTVN